jgi:hypothetical protein
MNLNEQINRIKNIMGLNESYEDWSGDGDRIFNDVPSGDGGYESEENMYKQLNSYENPFEPKSDHDKKVIDELRRDGFLTYDTDEGVDFFIFSDKGREYFGKFEDFRDYVSDIYYTDNDHLDSERKTFNSMMGGTDGG